MLEARRRFTTHVIGNAVQDAILFCNPRGDRIDIGRQDGNMGNFCQGDCKHAGSRSNIHRASRQSKIAGRLTQTGFQHIEAASGGAMMACPKGLSSINLDWNAHGFGSSAVMRAMNEKPTSTYGRKFFECFADPINVLYGFRLDRKAKTIFPETVSNLVLPMLLFITFNID